MEASAGKKPGGPERAGWDGEVMSNMRNWMFGAAVVAGGFGLGATTAQAAEFELRARGPAAYVPPRPGPGYVWTPGYEANGYWVSGWWNFTGGGDRRPFARFDGDRGREMDRRVDRDHARDQFRR
jgi:hypothetical protein